MTTYIESIQVVQRVFRTRRMREFATRFGVTSRTRVLDVGGTPFNWALLPERPRLTLLNVSPTPDFALPPGMRYIQGDGRQLPFEDGAFDIVFSNSVIEHVGGPSDQQRFALEVRRVGRSYYVQTPNRHFPIEPHVLGLGIHWLPRPWRYRLVRHTTVWGLLRHPSPEACRAAIDDVQLLDEKELRALFPDATMVREQLAGLTKSLIMMRPPSPTP